MKLNFTYPHLIFDYEDVIPVAQVCRLIQSRFQNQFHDSENPLLLQLYKCIRNDNDNTPDEVLRILKELGIDINFRTDIGIRSYLFVALSLQLYSHLNQWFTNPGGGILRKYMENPYIKRIEAIVAFKMSEFGVAEEILTKLLGINIHDYDARSLLMKIRIAQGKLEQAYSDLSFMAKIKIPPIEKGRLLVYEQSERDFFPDNERFVPGKNTNYICMPVSGLLATDALIGSIIDQDKSIDHDERQVLFDAAENGQMVTSNNHQLTILPKYSVNAGKEEFLVGLFNYFLYKNDKPEIKELVFFFSEIAYGDIGKRERLKTAIYQAVGSSEFRTPKFIKLV